MHSLNEVATTVNNGRTIEKDADRVASLRGAIAYGMIKIRAVLMRGGCPLSPYAVLGAVNYEFTNRYDDQIDIPEDVTPEEHIEFVMRQSRTFDEILLFRSAEAPRAVRH